MTEKFVHNNWTIQWKNNVIYNWQFLNADERVQI